MDQDFPDEISIAWLNRHPALEWHRAGYVRVRLPAGIATASALDDFFDEAVSLRSTPGDIPDSETVGWLCRHPQMNWEIGGAMQFLAGADGCSQSAPRTWVKDDTGKTSGTCRFSEVPDWPGRLVGQGQR